MLGRLQEYSRTGTLTTGTATTFGSALAPCDGSDLLPLRLRSTCSWVIPVCGTAPSWKAGGLLPSRAVPRRARFFARPADCGGRAFWRVFTLPKRSLRSGRAVAAVTLWVTASVQGPKLALDLTRLGRGFYFAPRRTVPSRRTGSVATPSRGTGDICLHPAIRRGGDDRTSCGRPFPGCPGLSQPRLQRVFHAVAQRLFYQGTRIMCVGLHRKSTGSYHQVLHWAPPRGAVNNF